MNNLDTTKEPMDGPNVKIPSDRNFPSCQLGMSEVVQFLSKPKSNEDLSLRHACDVDFTELTQQRIEQSYYQNFALAVFSHRENLWTKAKYSYIVYPKCFPTLLIKDVKWAREKVIDLGSFLGLRAISSLEIEANDLHYNLLHRGIINNNPLGLQAVTNKYIAFLKGLLPEKYHQVIQTSLKTSLINFVYRFGVTLHWIYHGRSLSISTTELYGLVNYNPNMINEQFLHKVSNRLQFKDRTILDTIEARELS